MPTPVWREIFLEIALRALKRVHLSHSPWLLRKNKVDVKEIRFLNNGQGVFHAQETTVASEISNEFIYSSFTNGMLIGNKGNVDPNDDFDYSTRYFEVHREISIAAVDSKKTFFNQNGKQEQKSNVIDLIVRRWEYINNAPNYKRPSLIELKRYDLFKKVNIGNGESLKIGSNIGEIYRDIKNLLLLQDYWPYVKNETNNFEFRDPIWAIPFLYILTWGIYTDAVDIKDKLKKLLEVKFNNVDVNDIHIKWMPISIKEDKDLINNTPQVDEWLWLALIEVTNYTVKP